MSPMNIAILAAIGGLLMLMLTLRRRRARADGDSIQGGAGWASAPEPAGATPAPAPSASPTSGAWVVGGGGTAAAHDGPFGGGFGAEGARAPADLVTAPGWPLPEAGDGEWEDSDDDDPGAGEPTGRAAGDDAAEEPVGWGGGEPGWFAPSAAGEPGAPGSGDDASAATGPMPVVGADEDAGLAAAWASWMPDEDSGAALDEGHAVHAQPALAAAQQAAALTLDPAAPPADDDIAGAFAAFAAEPPVEAPPVHAWEPPPAPALPEAPASVAPVPEAARNIAPGEDIFASFIAQAPASVEPRVDEEPLAWWDLPEPGEGAGEPADGTRGLDAGRFAVGGHALFPGHEMVGAVQFRAPRDTAPDAWRLDDAGVAPVPGEIRVSVEGSRNVAEGGVEVLTEPGFAPCEEGFTLRVRAADVGPVLVSGTYRIG